MTMGGPDSDSGQEPPLPRPQDPSRAWGSFARLCSCPHRYNVRMQAFFTIKQKAVANGSTANELEDGNDHCCSDDPSMPLLGSGKAEQTGETPASAA